MFSQTSIMKDSQQNIQAQNFCQRFIQSANQIHNNTRKILNIMKKAQTKVVYLQNKIKKQQVTFKQGINALNKNKLQENLTIPQQFYLLFSKIQANRAELNKQSLYKKYLANQLAQEVQHYYNILNNQYQNRYNNNNIKKSLNKKDEYKKGQKKENKRYNELFCYCKKKQFGQMVGCENTYCQNKWFHRYCIEETVLPEIWYCKECKLQLQKLQKIKVKEFYNLSYI